MTDTLGLHSGLWFLRAVTYGDVRLAELMSIWSQHLPCVTVLQRSYSSPAATDQHHGLDGSAEIGLFIELKLTMDSSWYKVREGLVGVQPLVISRG